jgi:hypothetical protein
MGILTWIGQFVLKYLLDKLSAWAAALIAKIKRKKQVTDESDASVQPLKDAKNAEEIDKSTDSALDGF